MCNNKLEIGEKVVVTSSFNGFKKGDIVLIANKDESASPVEYLVRKIDENHSRWMFGKMLRKLDIGNVKVEKDDVITLLEDFDDNFKAGDDCLVISSCIDERYDETQYYIRKLESANTCTWIPDYVLYNLKGDRNNHTEEGEDKMLPILNSMLCLTVDELKGIIKWINDVIEEKEKPVKEMTIEEIEKELGYKIKIKNQNNK